MTILATVAADDPPSSAVSPAPPGGPATAPGPALIWGWRARFWGGAFHHSPRAGVLIGDDDIWCGFAEYLRRKTVD